jgi:hypothetical protein
LEVPRVDGRADGGKSAHQTFTTVGRAGHPLAPVICSFDVRTYGRVIAGAAIAALVALSLAATAVLAASPTAGRSG